MWDLVLRASVAAGIQKCPGSAEQSFPNSWHDFILLVTYRHEQVIMPLVMHSFCSSLTLLQMITMEKGLSGSCAVRTEGARRMIQLYKARGGLRA